MTAWPSPTDRGRTLAALAVLAVVLSTVSESRSVAVAAVATVTLLVTTGAWLLTVDVPPIERDVTGVGTVGETVEVHLSVPRRPGLSLRIRDQVGEVSDASAVFETVADGRRVGYDLALHRRGVQWIGPITVAMRDPFGLWSRRAIVDRRDDLTVYPRRRSLRTDVGRPLEEADRRADRTTVGEVREYVTGDSLRRVNWRASAKRPDTWVVNEFVGTVSPDAIVVAVGAERAAALDTVAEAAASVVVHFLDRGTFVGLRTPAETIAPGTGTDHRHRLLAALARFDGGALPEGATDGGTVRVVDESRSRVTIAIGETTHRYRDLLADGSVDETSTLGGRWATITGDDLAP